MTSARGEAMPKPGGHVALVTGGARRVGQAIALELAQAGYDVAVHYRESEGDAQTVVKLVQALGRRAVAVRGDLADPESWKPIIDQTIEALGRLDVLVNNASSFLTSTPDTLDDFTPQLWDSMLRTNLTAPVALCHYARGHLAKHDRGRIVNLLDASVDRPWPAHLAYSASKAALLSVTRALAKALAPAILVNGVAPGIAVFPESYPPEVREALTRKVPLGRSGTPRDIARAVRFLVLDGDYITGQVITVDGGRSLI